MPPTMIGGGYRFPSDHTTNKNLEPHPIPFDRIRLYGQTMAASGPSELANLSLLM
jgi:hypothetical protein